MVLGLIVAVLQIFSHSLESASKYQWAVHHGLNCRVVRHGIYVQPHRQINLNLVAGFPVAVESEIAARTGEGWQSGAVDPYTAALRPVRYAKVDGERRRSLCRDNQCCSLLLGEARFLPHAKPFFWPVEIGINVEVDVKGLVVMKVNRVGELRVLFRSGTRAAPK